MFYNRTLDQTPVCGILTHSFILRGGIRLLLLLAARVLSKEGLWDVKSGRITARAGLFDISLPNSVRSCIP